MVSTRSSTSATKQTHLDDFAEAQSTTSADPPQLNLKAEKVRTGYKREASSTPPPAVKKQRTASPELAKPKHKKPVARSKSGQTKLDVQNVTEQLASPETTISYKTSASPKHKAAEDMTTDTATKTEEDGRGDIIMINRSPVLNLWAASVAHFLYPKVSWETCLSVGSAVASLCAVSKGRSIGVIDNKDVSGEHKTKEEQPKIETIEVMGFKLHLKDGLVVLGKDKKNANERALKGKYGDEQYERVRKTFEDELQTWQDEKKGLDQRAFGMYEDFRPNVAFGQQGWGRKGELSLEKIQEVVAMG